MIQTEALIQKIQAAETQRTALQQQKAALATRLRELQAQLVFPDALILRGAQVALLLGLEATSVKPQGVSLAIPADTADDRSGTTTLLVEPQGVSLAMSDVPTDTLPNGDELAAFGTPPDVPTDTLPNGDDETAWLDAWGETAVPETTQADEDDWLSLFDQA